MERIALLAGVINGGARETGKTVCSCFSVSEENIRAAIRKDGLTSPAEIGARAQGRHQLRLLHSGTEEAAGSGSATAGGKPMTISTACLDGTLPTVAEALALVAPHLCPVTHSEQISLDHAAGRILARDVIAPAAMPPWPRAAMDGFAFRSGSGAPLRLVGAATAGKAFGGRVQLGECVAISTGARLPEGCDTVAMREHCSQERDKVWLGALLKRGAHVRAQGEDYSEGAVLLTAGTRLDARAIALLASAGITHAVVHRPVRAAILSVGDELKTGSIRDSNRALLTTLLAGVEVSDLGILADRRDDIQTPWRGPLHRMT